MSSKEHSDPKFREAVDMQWENIDKCIDDTIDRNNPDFSNYFEMESSEKRGSYKSMLEFMDCPLQSTGIFPEFW